MTKDEFKALKKNDVVYSFVSSIESENYGDTSPVPPYPAKVRPTGHEDLIRIYRFNKETGEIDDDTNASAFVRSGDVYTTLAEATTQWQKEKIRHAIYRLKEAEDFIDDCGLKAMVGGIVTELKSRLAAKPE